MRRGGMPLLGMGGMGMGSPLMTGLMAGGIGYLLGSNANQQATPQVQQVMPVPTYPYPQPQWSPPPPASPAPVSSADGGTLAQLKLLGDLHASGVLTDEEFVREKNRIMGR
jgi:hypothetical protein